MSYRPESASDTTFAEGKRFVGNTLVKFINMPREQMEKVKQHERSNGSGNATRRDPDRSPAAEQRASANANAGADAKPKRRGRPPGAKDKKPRKRRAKPTAG